MPAVLTISNLSCERDERPLFSGLNLSIEAGQVVQVAGPNGAGKTTLLKVLTGLSSLYEGSIDWQGSGHANYEFFSSLLYLGHNTGVNSSLTALENLESYFGLNGLKQTIIDGQSDPQISPSVPELLEALAKVGLKGYADVPCQQMSAGQKRRVALARLYCSKAPLWVLDEPFTAIDVRGVELLEQRIEAHANHGGVVVLTTHQPLNIENYHVLDIAEFAGGNS